MRDGRIRGRHRAADVSRPQIVAEMIGDASGEGERRVPVARHAVALETRGLSVFEPEGRPRVTGLDLAVREGEVVGLFGLLGAGCIEAALAIYGAWPGRCQGEILIAGKPVSIDRPDQAVALGLGLMAQDRRDCLVGEQTVSDNIVMASFGCIVRHGALDIALGRRHAQDQSDALGIKASSIDTEVRTLSGGNQQKVQIARWLTADSQVLIMIDPTRGVDVGARRDIKAIWSGLARDGKALLLASTDAEELVDTCDRVVVLSHGRRVGELSGSDLTEKNLVRMAADV
jgi:monosaccharide-transporting ATPase